MQSKDTSAFTLVELVVVITIMAILGTIAFISLVGYSQDARNSSRISDMKVVQKTLNLFYTVDGYYPFPDNRTSITYSGGLAWSQGIFGSGVIKQTGRISHVPIDDTSGTEFSYGILNNRSKYQIGGIIEGGLFSYSPPFIPQAHAALDNNNIKGYILGTYNSYDINVSVGTGCTLITAPSLLLSDIPAGGALLAGSSYNYVHLNSVNLPSTYSGSVTMNIPNQPFQMSEVGNSCSISDLSSLQLYIAQLSTSYQQLVSYPKFEGIIYNSDTTEFQITTTYALIENGIDVSAALLKELNAPIPDNIFVDTFTDTNATELAGGHISDSASGSWSVVSGGTTSSYTISSNTLSKADSSSTAVYPLPDPVITSSGSSNVSFDVEDFSGGSIYAYLRYTDSNNYYGVDLDSAGYRVLQKVTGTETVFTSIGDPIANGSRIQFLVSGDSLILRVDSVEKENILTPGAINSVGNPVIYMENSGAVIDNYTLRYR